MKFQKKILTLVGVSIMATSVPTFASPTNKEVTFKDLDKDKWYIECMTDLAEKGVFKGNDGLIRPNDPVTRAEYAQIIYNISKEKGLLNMDGTDLDPDAWYFDAMQAAITFGVIRGDGYDNYRPNAHVTREEVFVMTSRAFQIKRPMFTNDGEEIIYDDLTLNFKDHKDLSSWAQRETNFLIMEGLLKGNQDNKLLPKQKITRAELASLIQNVEDVKALPKLVKVKTK